MVDIPQPTQMAQAAPQPNPISFGKKQQPPQFQLPERKGAYGKANMTFIERLVGGAPAVSAALQDNRAQEQQFYQQQQLGSKADQLGLQGRERLAFMVNPEEYTKNLSTNYAAANVAGGDSRYIHGQGMVTAPKMVNNGNQFFTQGANGTQQTGDFGQTYDEQNTAFNNDTTRQNNLATQDLRGGELEETIRNNTMTNERGVFDNTTGRMEAITNRDQTQFDMSQPQGLLTPLQQLQYEKTRAEMDQSQSDRESAETTSRLKQRQTLGNIARLKSADPNIEGSKPGELNGAFRMLYGKSRYAPFANMAGTERADAQSVIDQLTSNLTIDSLSAFKGAISEKEMAVAADAATRLQNPNISENEAMLALNEIEQVMSKTDINQSQNLQITKQQAEAELRRRGVIQ